jgi:hypothetical protein
MAKKASTTKRVTKKATKVSEPEVAHVHKPPVSFYCHCDWHYPRATIGMKNPWGYA